MFEGFSRESVEFLWNIRFNNYRTWYQEHKEECHRYVDAPMKALAGQLLESMDRTYPDLRLTSKVSRIYRDTRRLYGRPPYRDHLWFSLFSMVRSTEGQPSFYFELAPERYSYGVGCWMISAQSMARLRARIDGHRPEMERLFRRLRLHPEFELDTQPYKRPKGDVGPLLNPVYNSRRIGINCDCNCEGVLFTPELYEQILRGFHFLVPYFRLFQELVWDQTQPAMSET